MSEFNNLQYFKKPFAWPYNPYLPIKRYDQKVKRLECCLLVHYVEQDVYFLIDANMWDDEEKIQTAIKTGRKVTPRELEDEGWKVD